jgi:hypothetical protein
VAEGRPQLLCEDSNSSRSIGRVGNLDSPKGLDPDSISAQACLDLTRATNECVATSAILPSPMRPANSSRRWRLPYLSSHRVSIADGHFITSGSLFSVILRASLSFLFFLNQNAVDHSAASPRSHCGCSAQPWSQEASWHLPSQG